MIYLFIIKGVQTRDNYSNPFKTGSGSSLSYRSSNLVKADKIRLRMLQFGSSILLLPQGPS